MFRYHLATSGHPESDVKASAPCPPAQGQSLAFRGDRDVTWNIPDILRSETLTHNLLVSLVFVISNEDFCTALGTSIIGRGSALSYKHKPPEDHSIFRQACSMEHAHKTTLSCVKDMASVLMPNSGP